MPHGWWRRAIERRLETLSAIALIVWVSIVAGASAIATNRVTTALSSERGETAARIAVRVERALDAELTRLYRETEGANVPLTAQLQRAVPALGTVLHDYHSEPYRVALVDAGGRELTASAPAWPAGEKLVATTARVGRSDWSIRIDQPHSAALGPVFWLRRLLVWSAVLSCALAVVLAWGAAQSVRRPIVRLTADAQRIARGDLKQPIAPAGVDEIGRLAAALEQMRHALVQDELLGRLLRKVIAAQEEERKRLARELHDETSQQLTALAMQLDLIERAPGSAGCGPRLVEARALVGTMIDDLHRVIYDLRPSILDDLGLLPAIKWYAERRLASRGIAVQFEFPDAPPELSPEALIAVYRVAQEALSNVERHSQADTVLVACTVSPSELTIEVEDDGIGFDPEEMRQPRETGQGLGLLGMRERLSLFGGTCKVESQPGQGTRVVLTLPLKNAERPGRRSPEGEGGRMPNAESVNAERVKAEGVKAEGVIT
ncbi:MAG TPA: sensor histidine kinase [Vicinamibacterales bacterium]|nr:sensor histidine kinase [Vicinamibacterales bacterium]